MDCVRLNGAGTQYIIELSPTTDPTVECVDGYVTLDISEYTALENSSNPLLDMDDVYALAGIAFAVWGTAWLFNQALNFLLKRR